CHHAPWRNAVTSTMPQTVHASAEPANPSHVFFGEIVGAIGCLPKNTPAAYPPTSLHTTVAMKIVVRRGPSGGAVNIAAKPARNGAYTAMNTPAETSRR